MQVALNASVQGLQRAEVRLEQAATSIAAATPGAARGADPSPAPPRGNAALTAAQGGADIEAALVDAMQARRAYEANAETLRRNSETERQLLSRSA